MIQESQQEVGQHLVAMGINARGNASAGTGTTGISKQSGTGTVIGANTSDIDATNYAAET